jgi:hypothetical protein
MAATIADDPSVECINSGIVATMTQDVRKLFEQTNGAGLQLMLTDADMGLTFVDLARSASNKEHVTQATKDARKAYDTICDTRSRYSFNAEEAAGLDAELEKLRAGLVLLGESF